MSYRNPKPRQLQMAELPPHRAQLLAEHVFGEVRR